LVGLHRTIPLVTRHSEWVPTGRLDSGHMPHPRLPELCLNVLDRMDSRVRGNVVGELAKRSLAMGKLLMPQQLKETREQSILGSPRPTTHGSVTLCF